MLSTNCCCHQVVEHTTKTLLPSFLCEYLYGLCETLNHFYKRESNCRVLDAPEEGSRVLLLLACLQGMQKCYQLLGITYLPRL